MGSVNEGDLSVQDEATGRKALGIRERVPVLGLKEYWYPAVRARKVGPSKPVSLTLLGEKLVFFRDDNNEVVALHHTCSHRGASLAYGDIHFKGKLTCPYHGWTFDGKGNLLAVLGEGPESTLPGAKGTKMRNYPTRTLKGTVFVWMGEGAPAPIEEDVPPELFDPDIVVMTSERLWRANWRPGIENFTDSHAYFVHKNSLEVLFQPPAGLLAILHSGPTRPPFHVVNGRMLCFAPQSVSVLDYMDRRKDAAPERKRDFQDTYEALGGVKFPSSRWRLHLSKLCGLLRGLFKPTGPLATHPEWGSGAHLPGIIHIDYHRHIYCRFEVPVDESNTNNFFFCAWRAKTPLARLWWAFFFHAYFDWKMTRHFSGQDAFMAEISDYSAPERMSGSDLFPREWRRFVLEHARGVKREA